MKITVITQDDQFKEIYLYDDAVVADVKQMLEIEFRVPIAMQELYSNNVAMKNERLIKDYCNNLDMIRLAVKAPPQQNFNPFGNPQAQQQGGVPNLNDPSSIANALGNLFGNALGQNQSQKFVQQAKKWKEELSTGPYLLEDLKGGNPELYDLLSTGSIDQLAKYLEELQELEKNPFDPENQRKIQEIIYQKQIDENLEMAQEYQPEVFGKITMLYVDISVNNHQIQAFVDTGAESTIMSLDCANRCGITRLIDKRFSGTASGVGTGKILGKIHSYPIQMLDKKIPCSFTVLETINLDFLLGLDSLRRFQGLVNLKEDSLCLIINGQELKVPFLQEKEIKKTVSIAQEQALYDEEQKRQQQQNKK